MHKNTSSSLCAKSNILSIISILSLCIYTQKIYNPFFSNNLFTAFKLLAKIVGIYCPSCADLQTRPGFHRVELLCSQYHVTRVTNIPVSLPNPEERVLHSLTLPFFDNPNPVYLIYHSTTNQCTSPHSRPPLNKPRTRATSRLIGTNKRLSIQTTPPNKFLRVFRSH